MKIDEKRENALTNYHAFKTVGRIVESAHNVEILEVDIKFSHFQPDRIEMFQFKNQQSQLAFKRLTSIRTINFIQTKTQKTKRVW